MESRIDPNLPEVGSFSLNNERKEPTPSVKLTEDQNSIYEHIKQLLKEVRNRMYVNGDVDIMHTNFKREYTEKFSALLQRYGKEISENINLDQILNEVLNEQDHSELIKTLKTIILDAIKSIGTIELDNSISARQFDSNDINNVEYVNDSVIEDTIRKIQSNQNIKDIKLKLIKINDENLKEIISKYRKFIFDDILPKTNVKFIKNSVQENNERYPQNKKKKFWKFNIYIKRTLDDTSKKYANKTVSRLYSIIKYGLVIGFFHKVGELFTSTLKHSISIVKHIGHFVNELIKGVFSVFSNFILKPIWKVLSIPFKIIFQASKIIFKNIIGVTKLLSRGIGYILMTPQGMYALGFLLGYIWERIRSYLPQEEDISFDSILNGISRISEKIFNKFDEYMYENHPVIWGYVKKTYNIVKDFIDNSVIPWINSAKTCVEKLIGKDSNESAAEFAERMFQDTKKSWESFNSKVIGFTGGLNVSQTLDEIIGFFSNNMETIGWISTAATLFYAAFKVGGPMRYFLKFMPKIGGLNLFQSLALGISLYGGQLLGDAVFQAFYGIDQSHLLFSNDKMEELNEQFSYMKFNLEDRLSIMDVFNGEKYRQSSEILQKEYNEIRTLMKDINYMFRDEELLNDRKPLYSLIKNMLISAYSSPYMPERDLEYYKENGNLTIKEQLNTFVSDISTRIINVGDLVSTLNSLQGNELNDFLSKFDFKKGYRIQQNTSNEKLQYELPKLQDGYGIVSDMNKNFQIKDEMVVPMGEFKSYKTDGNNKKEYNRWVSAQEQRDIENTHTEFGIVPGGLSAAKSKTVPLTKVYRSKMNTLELLKNAEFSLFGFGAGSIERNKRLERIMMMASAEQRNAINDLVLSSDKKDHEKLQNMLEQMYKPFAQAMKHNKESIDKKKQEMENQIEKTNQSECDLNEAKIDFANFCKERGLQYKAEDLTRKLQEVMNRAENNFIQSNPHPERIQFN